MTASNHIDFTTLGKDMQELIRASVAAREFSYSPYSKFKVGAALRCNDDTITRGCNVENSSFPVSTCAERVAIVKAISEGKNHFTAIAIAADMTNNEVSSPCGMCRQALAEFGNIPIYLTTPDMTKIVKTSVIELLPMAFGLNAFENRPI